jgi:predicted RNase H-like nuclease (RuvC/YqgF family)
MFVLGETPMPEALEDAIKLIEEVAKERDDQQKHARTWEQRAKDNKDAAPERDQLKADNEKLEKRVKELETAQDSSQSDVEKAMAKIEADNQKLAERLATAEQTAASEKITTMKVRIAADKKLPAAFAELLKGDDEEAIKAHADALLEAIPAGTPVPGVPGQGDRGVKPDKPENRAAELRAAAGLPPK